MRRTTAASASLMRRSTCDRWPSGAEDLDVVVAEHAPAGDVAGLRLPLHRVVGALPRLLALELVGERRQRQHDLVGGGVERPLAVLEVEEHAHAGLHELLERVRRLDRLASEP